MITLNELREMPEAKRLQKAAVFTGCVWVAAVVFIILALSALGANEQSMSDARSLLDAAVTVRSYPKQEGSSAAEPLTAVSSILDKLGLQPKVSQMGSSPAGLTLQLNRLYPGEFARLSEEIQSAGLSVKTAEIRTLTGPQDGRLLNVSLTLDGVQK